ADAPGPFLECGGFIRCVDELLTESCVASIYLATKGTLSCCALTTIGEDRAIELKHEPPVDRVSSGEKWRGACGTYGRGWRRRRRRQRRLYLDHPTLTDIADRTINKPDLQPMGHRL